MNPGNYQLNVGEKIDTGVKWLGERIFTKIIDVGALPNNTTKDVAHGESLAIEGFTSARVFGWDADNALCVHRDLTIELTSTHVRLVTATNLSGITQAYVQIEFTEQDETGS